MDFAKLVYVDAMAAVVLIMPTVLVMFWLMDRRAPAKRQRETARPHGSSPLPAE